MIGDISGVIKNRAEQFKSDERKVEPILPSNSAHNHSQKDSYLGTRDGNKNYQETPQQDSTEWQYDAHGRLIPA